MGEISAVTAARAAVIKNDAQALRDRREDERRRLDALQQRRADLARIDAQKVEARRGARAESKRDTIRAEAQTARFNNAERIARDVEFQDNRDAVVHADLRDQRIAADQLRVARDKADLNVKAPLTSERTPEDAALARARELANARGSEPLPPFAPIELRDRPAAAPSQAPEPLAAPSEPLQPLEPFRPADNPNQVDQATFNALEQQRLDRIAERRSQDTDFQVRQQIDLQIAQDRIDQSAFDPGVPRGSVVDVFG